MGEVMRKKKAEYLEYQRQLALQRMAEQEREVASKAAGYLPHAQPPAPGMYMQGPTGPGPMYMPQHYPGMMPPGGPMYPGQGYQVHQAPPPGGEPQQQQPQSGPSMGGQPVMGGQGPASGPVMGGQVPVMGGQVPSSGPDQGQTFNMSALAASLPPQQPQQQPPHPHQQIPQPEAPAASLISFD